MFDRTVPTLLLLLATLLPADARAAGDEPWLAVEEEILDEINLLRANPEQYVQQVLEPLTATAKRVPSDSEQPFQAFRVLLGEAAIDYIELDEGETEADALAIVGEAIRDVKAAGVLPKLSRNDVLNAAARFFSRDYATARTKMPPHIDSLGRGPAARIASFGLTEQALHDWAEFARRSPADGHVTIRVFKSDNSYFHVELPAGGGYRYWYVTDAFGEFVKKHGQEATIARVNQEGFEARLELDVDRRILTAGEESVGYPLPLPTHGENVVWGAWSRELAARGMVCWWVLDPGIEGRGHRKLLLDRDFKYCGIGVTRSRKTGWVATLDVTSEPLVAFPDNR